MRLHPGEIARRRAIGYVTCTEAGAMCGRHRSTIWRAAKAGYLEHEVTGADTAHEVLWVSLDSVIELYGCGEDDDYEDDEHEVDRLHPSPALAASPREPAEHESGERASAPDEHHSTKAFAS